MIKFPLEFLLRYSVSNCEGPDESAFHMDLHCLLRLKQSSGSEIHLNLEVLTSDPLNMYNKPSQVYCIKPDGKTH